jgi:hypothetical protein
MNKSIILLILPIFFIGCIGSDVRMDANNGIIVNEFSADPLQAQSDDVVSLFLDIENVGGTTANCVTSEIFGVDSWRDEMGNPFSTIYAGTIVPSRGLSFNYFDGNFDICYSDYTNANGGGTVGNVCVSRIKDRGVSLTGFVGNTFGVFTDQYCDSYLSSSQKLGTVKFHSQLTAPDKALNRPGQSQTVEWLLRPPILPEGVSADYPITVRTSYFYSSNAIMNVRAMNKAEAKRQVDQGKSIDAPLVVENSFGTPIQVFASRGPSPIIVNPDSYSITGNPIQYESFRFEFANLGQGFPLPMSSIDSPSQISPETQSGFMIVTLSVSGPGVFFSDCMGQGGSDVTDIMIPAAALSSLVKLRSDQRVPVGCTIGIDTAQWIDHPMDTITFNANLQYRYYIDKEITVRVLGTQGLSGSAVVGR